MTKAFPPNALRQSGQLAQAWEFELPADRTIEEALEPEAWAHVGVKLRPHDTIRLIPVTSRDFIQLLVLEAGRGFAKVRLLHHIETEAPADDAEAPSDLTVKWISPGAKFGVIRNSDKTTLKNGFENRQDAQRWADDHLASLAR